MSVFGGTIRCMGESNYRIRVSVIIPAANEEQFLPLAIDSLKRQTLLREEFEIIVSVNGSSDKTFEYAKSHADQVVFSEAPLTPALARNRGAEIARGQVLVFLDADSILSPSALESIAHACKDAVYGSVRCAPDQKRLSALIFMGLKNFIHLTGLYKGVGGGLFYCSATVFRRSGGFNGRKRVSEFQELIARLRQGGNKYVFVYDAVATTSIRRFEKTGFFKTIWFWIRWWFAWRLGLLVGDDKEANQVAGEYHP